MEARATRFYAANKSGSAFIDTVLIETEKGDFNIAYDIFESLFDQKLAEGSEIGMRIETTRLPASAVSIPR